MSSGAPANDRKKRIQTQTGDFWFVILTLGLVVFGVIMVFSASYYSAMNTTGDPYYYLKLDAAYAVSGLVLMIIMSRIDYRYWRVAALPLVAISIIGLLLIFTPLGVTINYATRWIKVPGTNFTLMPAEFAKFAAIIFVAYFLSAKSDRILSFTRGIVPCVALMLAYVFLIMKQPNLSTAITISAIIFVIMFVAGLQWRYIILAGFAGIGGVFALITAPGGEYRLERLTSFRNPFADKMDTGYQVVQSLLALGSGGLFGLGLGKGVQKTLYLPEPQNDFILAIIGEELGFLGVIALMIAYVVLIWRGIHIAVNAPDTFGMLVAAGISAMIGIQVVLNVAVVTSSMPPTGITLPFVSYGGTALWLFMCSAGIMLNISRHKKVEE